jgi:hypothetical protein
MTRWRSASHPRPSPMRQPTQTWVPTPLATPLTQAASRLAAAALPPLRIRRTLACQPRCPLIQHRSHGYIGPIARNQPRRQVFNNSNAQFWELVLPGCDALGYVACTGTNFCIRAAALAAVGWFPEYTITEGGWGDNVGTSGPGCTRVRRGGMGAATSASWVVVFPWKHRRVFVLSLSELDGFFLRDKRMRVAQEGRSQAPDAP